MLSLSPPKGPDSYFPKPPVVSAENCIGTFSLDINYFNKVLRMNAKRLNAKWNERQAPERQVSVNTKRLNAKWNERQVE